MSGRSTRDEKADREHLLDPRRGHAGPGGPGEDDSGGFAHGGWSVHYFDEDVGQFMTEALNVVLVVLVTFALRPGVSEMAELDWRFMTGEMASLAVGDLIFPPIVLTSALLIAFVLAVFRP